LGKEERRRREEVEEGVEGGGKENLTSTTQRSLYATCVPKARIYARRTTSPCGDVDTTETQGRRRVYPKTIDAGRKRSPSQPRAESRKEVTRKRDEWRRRKESRTKEGRKKRKERKKALCTKC
jgi:hypothetical protein